MIPEKEDQQNDSPDNEPKKFVDEVTQNKINRHLHDINDLISEQDIRNIKTDISSPSISGNDEIDNDRIPLTDKKTNEGNDDKDQLPTTWNVLD